MLSLSFTPGRQRTTCYLYLYLLHLGDRGQHPIFIFSFYTWETEDKMLSLTDHVVERGGGGLKLSLSFHHLDITTKTE